MQDLVLLLCYPISLGIASVLTFITMILIRIAKINQKPQVVVT